MNFAVLAPLAALGVFVTGRDWRKNWLIYVWGLVPLRNASVLRSRSLSLSRRSDSWHSRRSCHRQRSALVDYFTGTDESRRRRRCGLYRSGLQLADSVQVADAGAYEYNVAAALETAGRRDEAIFYYRRAVDLFPEFPEAHSNLGILLASQGDHDGALSDNQTAARLDPELVAAQVNVGIELAQRGAYDDAYRVLNRAVALDSSNPSAHYNLGLALAARGDADKARQSFETAVRWIRTTRTHITISVSCSRRRETLSSAIAHFRAALTIRPDYKEAAANLAHAEGRDKNP